MDIRAKIDELTDKVKNDPDAANKFKENPVSAVESLLGIDLPDEQIQQVVETIKSKVSLDKIGDALGGLFGKK